MSVFVEVLIALSVIGLVSALTVTLVLRMLYLRIRRSRALAGAALRTRAGISAGPRRRVLKLRVRLTDTLASAQAAFELAVRSDGPRGEVPRLFERIHQAGTVLESQLRLMESESDPDTLAAAITEGTYRVDQVADMVHRLRAAVSDGLGNLGGDTLDMLHSEVDREVAALNAGVQELRLLNGNDNLFGTRHSSASPSSPTGSTSTRSMDHLHKGNTP